MAGIFSKLTSAGGSPVQQIQYQSQPSENSDENEDDVISSKAFDESEQTETNTITTSKKSEEKHSTDKQEKSEGSDEDL